MATTLFSQANPGATSSGAGNDGTNGLHFTVSAANQQLDGVWHYSPSGATQLPTSIGLYSTQAAPTSGTLVHSETVSSWSGAAGSGWVFAAFASPPALTSGTNYMATQFRNDATNRWFDFYTVTWPVTNGVLTAPKDESTSALSQGWYSIGTTMAFPTNQSGTGGSNFGMDVQVSTIGALAESAGGTSTWPTNAGAATTGTITPASGDLLVAIAVCGNGYNDPATSIAMSGTGAMSGTWTLKAHLYLTTGPMVGIFMKDAGTSPASGTATATFSSTEEGVGLIVRRFANAAPTASQTGVTVTGGSGGGGVYSLATGTGLTTGSQVVGGYADSSNTITLTANGATTIYSQAEGLGDTEAAFKASSLSTAGTSMTLGFTNTGGDSTSVVLVEVLPATGGSGGVTSTATFGLPAFGLSATGNLGPVPVTSTGQFALATLGLSASAIEVITSSGAFAMSPLSSSGSGGPLTPVSITGSFKMGPMGASGSGGPLTPVGMSGSFGMAPFSLTGVAPTGSFDLAPGNAPLPEADLNPMVELYLKNSQQWLDITSRVFYDSSTPAAILQRGGPDESTTTTAATFSATLDNHDGVLSNLNPMSPYYGQLGMNTPLRCSVPNGSTYLRVEASASDGAACPSSSAINTSGNLEIWFDADLDNWYSPQVLAAKWATSANERSWMLLAQANGCLQFIVPGSGFYYAWISAPLPIVHGRMSVRLEFQPATGTAFFYTGTYCSSWTLLGTSGTTYGTATPIPALAAPLSVGWCSDQSDWTNYVGCLGKIYAFALVAGNNNPISSALAYADFTQVGAGINNFTDGKGNNWSVYNSAVITNRDYRFFGEADSWPQSWTVGDNNARISITAAGLLRRLGSVNATANSAMRRAYTRALASNAGTGIVSYWPMEDLSQSTALASALPGQPPLYAGTGVNVSAFSGFACSAPIPTLNDGVIYGTVPVYTPGTGSGAGGSVMRWLMDMGTSAPTTGAILATFQFIGGSVGRVDVIAQGLNVLSCIAYAPDGSTVLANTGAFAVPVVGAPSWSGRMSLEYLVSGSGIAVSLVFIEAGQNVGYVEAIYSASSGSVGRCSRVIFGYNDQAQSISVGHLAIQTQWTSLYDMASALIAYDQEPAGVRFSRICQEEGIAFRSMGNLADTTPLGPQTVETLTAILQECVDADQGIWYEPRQVLGWGFRTRASLANQLAAVTFDYNLDQLSDTLEPTVDDQVIKNDVTVTSQNGGSSARFTLDDGSAQAIGTIGRYDTEVTINVDNPLLPSMANWLLWVLSCGDPRYKAVNCDLANAGLSNAMYYAILQADVGDRINIIHPPVWLPPGIVDQLMKGTKETISAKAYSMSWNGIPTLPWNVAFANDPSYGRLDSDGSQLAAAVGTTATTLSVATVNSGSPLWTTTSTDWPFNIMVDGEEMTVTAVSGTSSPQAFTVTRSVNGVVKSHVANATVSLLPEPVVSL